MIFHRIVTRWKTEWEGRSERRKKSVNIIWKLKTVLRGYERECKSGEIRTEVSCWYFESVWIKLNYRKCVIQIVPVVNSYAEAVFVCFSFVSFFPYCLKLCDLNAPVVVETCMMIRVIPHISKWNVSLACILPLNICFGDEYFFYSGPSNSSNFNNSSTNS